MTQSAGPSVLSIFPSSDAFIAAINFLMTTSSRFSRRGNVGAVALSQNLQFAFSFGLGDPLPVAIRLFKLPRMYVPQASEQTL